MPNSSAACLRVVSVIFHPAQHARDLFDALLAIQHLDYGSG